jgi:hypothetical protein
MQIDSKLIKLSFKIISIKFKKVLWFINIKKRGVKKQKRIKHSKKLKWPFKPLLLNNRTC